MAVRKEGENEGNEESKGWRDEMEENEAKSEEERRK